MKNETSKNEKGKSTMFVSTNLEVIKRADGIYVTYNGEEKVATPTNADFAEWLVVYANLRNVPIESRTDLFQNSVIDDNPTDNILTRLFPSIPTGEGIEVTVSAQEALKGALSKLINFFKEFEFEPNFRFVNTLSYKVKENKDKACDYIRNYFALVDNTYKTEVSNKIKSREFKDILDTFEKYANPTSHINQRFAVYYGSAGTGKTTLAMQESENRCVVCNASMLPSDLMEDFVFDSGKPTFQKSALWRCMEDGKPIVLDEINLLPFDSLRFLQGILDGKKEFDYKGHKVSINDGFRVIGTMNLSIGGMIYGLPEPLIDRCADMREFKLTAEQLLNAVIQP